MSQLSLNETLCAELANSEGTRGTWTATSSEGMKAAEGLGRLDDFGQIPLSSYDLLFTALSPHITAQPAAVQIMWCSREALSPACGLMSCGTKSKTLQKLYCSAPMLYDPGTQNDEQGGTLPSDFFKEGEISYFLASQSAPVEFGLLLVKKRDGKK